MYRLAVVAAIVILLFSCATSEGSLYDSVVQSDSEGTRSPSEPSRDPETGSKKEKPAEEETDADRSSPEQDGQASQPARPANGVYIVTQPDEADVYVNGAYAGTTPMLLTPKPGTFRLQISKPGYYSTSRWVTYTAGTRIEIESDLVRITGYLYVEVIPSDAQLYLNRGRIDEGVTELPVGRYTLYADRFGYESWSQTVSISERQTTSVSVKLEPAEFRISNATLSRRRFNPQNPGNLGLTRFSFDVTTYGTGRVAIYAENGGLVYETPMGPFRSRGQELVWNGTTQDGGVVADGRYRVEISGRARDDDTSDTEELFLVVDRSAVISYRALWSGVSGALYTPTPDVLPPGSFQVGVAAVGHYDPSSETARVPSQLSIRVSPVRNGELGLQGTLILGSSEVSPGSVGMSYKHMLLQSGTKNGLTASAYGKATYLGGTGADTLTNYTGLSVGGVAGIRFGPVMLSVAPELTISPFRVTYAPTQGPAALRAWAYGRAGVLFDAKWLTAGVSAAARTVPFNEGAGLQTPFAFAAEINVLLPDTSVFVNGIVAAEYSAPDNYYIMGGGGISILQ